MLRALRAAVVTTSYPSFDGDPAGHFVAAEVRAMAHRGEAVTVVAPAHGAMSAFGWPGVAARVRRNPLRAVTAGAWVVAARRRLVCEAAFARVVAHWAVPCAWPIGVAARGAELEAVSHGGDVRLLVAMPAPLRAQVARSIAARATTWRFVSMSLLESLLTCVPGETRRAVERVARVEACILHVPDVRGAVASKRAALGGERVAVCVARLVASKRVDVAIAYAAAKGRPLVVVGDGPERARLERLARDLRADVRFVGVLPRDEALAWIGAAEELVHASHIEGLSTVVREAEALGTNVTRLEGDAASALVRPSFG